MRNVKAKALRREAARRFPRGSRLFRAKSGAIRWDGARRAYQDSKKGVTA